MITQLAQFVEGLVEIFPETMDMDITDETKMEDLPDWESMAAVNIQALIERLFNINIPPDAIGDETTIGELLEMVNHPESLEA
jgi:acyl carrier protein